jgi:hypothetical protein
VDRIPYRPEITFRLIVDKNQVPLYDIGVVVDPAVLHAAGIDALEPIFRLLVRRVAADWETRLKSVVTSLEADKEN